MEFSTTVVRQTNFCSKILHTVHNLKQRKYYIHFYQVIP